MKPLKTIALTATLSCIFSNSFSQVYTDEVQVVEGLGGKVGIGINQPLKKLHVRGTGTNDGLIYAESVGTNPAVSVTAFNEFGGASLFTSGGTNHFLNGTVAGDGGIRFSNDKKLVIGANQAAYLTVNNNGNIGIGTTAPASKLSVIGQDAEFFSNTANNSLRLGRDINQNLRFYVSDNHGYIDYNQDSDEGAAHVLYIRNLAGGSSAANDIRFQTSGADRLIVNAAGQIGIGTLTPRNMGLTVEHVGTSNVDVWRNSNDSGGPAINLGKTRGTATYSNAVVQSEDVLGVIQFMGGDGSGAITPSAGASIASHAEGTQANNNVRARLTFYTRYSDGYLERMRITPSGNVGIGTTSPSQKLHVAGNVRATSFISSTQTYADFVFEDDYKLRPLSEIEQFIQKNKHLPEIPTEAEVMENGIDLAAMNVKLLQKVEELTLYLIEQNKKIEIQQKEIEKLKSKIR